MTLEKPLEYEDMQMLKLVATYGDGMSLSGPRVARASKAIANALLMSGYLEGKLGDLRLSKKGRAAITPAVSRTKKPGA